MESFTDNSTNEYKVGDWTVGSNERFRFYPKPDYTLLYTACTNVSINTSLTTRAYTYPGYYDSGTPDPNTVNNDVQGITT